MNHNSNIYNNLGDSGIGVWTKLHPEIDPVRWAQLCRSIGSLSQREFTLIVALVNAQQSLGNAVKRHIQAKLGIEGQGRDKRGIEWRDVPILSVGPSGIGGEYQREVGG